MEQLGLAELAPVLAACDIPVLTPRLAANPTDAATPAAELGRPAALKIASPDVTHKADVGGIGSV